MTFNVKLMRKSFLDDYREFFSSYRLWIRCLQEIRHESGGDMRRAQQQSKRQKRHFTMEEINSRAWN